tara:strand:+ start:500 stop:736 length:237 start_codon:yes stop_codon:yes gene_type:complete
METNLLQHGITAHQQAEDRLLGASVLGELTLKFGATDQKQLLAIRDLMLDAIEDLGFHGEGEELVSFWRVVWDDNVTN